MATANSASGTNDDNVIFIPGMSELQRINLQHAVIREVMENPVLAPIDLSQPGLRILDQATAGGEWLRDVQRLSPAQHQYVGTDIKGDYFPTDTGPDMSWYIQSMTAEWPDSFNSSFDLVHSRFALPGAGTNPVHDVVDRLIALVKPGGFIQLVEMEFGEWPGGQAVHGFRDSTLALLEMVTDRQTAPLRRNIQKWLKDAGLEGVTDQHYDILSGKWAKTDGIREKSIISMVTTSKAIAASLERMPPTDVPKETVDYMITNLENELRQNGGAYRIYVAWGRKPVK